MPVYMILKERSKAWKRKESEIQPGFEPGSELLELWKLLVVDTEDLSLLCKLRYINMSQSRTQNWVKL